MKIVFMGSPEFAIPALQKLIDSEHKILAVYTQPPKPKKRGLNLEKTPVHFLAEHHQIPIFTPKNFKDQSDIEIFKSHQADIAVVAAYGLLLPLPILNAFKYGAINIHGSLLPKWRGAAPVQYSLLNGDSETGITIMQMDQGLDTGNMLLKDTIPLNNDSTYTELYPKLASMGAELLIEALDLINNNDTKPEQQDDSQSCHAPKIKEQDYILNISNSKSNALKQINALNYNGCVFKLNDELTIKIFAAKLRDQNITNPWDIQANQLLIKCNDGTIAPTIIQLSGKNKILIKDFINGYRKKLLN